jgi:molybdate transport system substrate-binding protein
VIRDWLALSLAVMSASPAYAAEIRVFSGGAPQAALRVMTPEFENSSGHKVAFTFQIVSQIQQMLAAGEQAELIMLPNQLISETGKIVPLRTEGRVVLARVGIGVIVREGTARPDISSEEGVRKMLRAAKSIALADPRTPSGRHLGDVISRLGLADELKRRIIHKGAIHGGGELVATGEADLGMYLVSEVQNIKGVAVVGLLPPALQSHVVYAAAIPASNREPEPALSFIQFLTARDKAERWKQAGFELAGSP